MGVAILKSSSLNIIHLVPPFGRLQVHVLRPVPAGGPPEVLVISNIRENGQPIGLGDAGHFWHSDLSYKEVPKLGSMLHAPEHAGRAAGLVR